MTIPEKRLAQIIDYAGQDAIYRRVTSVTRTGLDKSRVTQDYPLKVAVRKYKDSELGGLVQQGDREVRIASDNIYFRPAKNDKLIIDGETYNVESADVRAVRNRTALYILRIRG